MTTAEIYDADNPPPPYGLLQVMRPMTSDEVMSLRTRLGDDHPRANPWQSYIVAQPRIRGGVL